MRIAHDLLTSAYFNTKTEMEILVLGREKSKPKWNPKFHSLPTPITVTDYFKLSLTAVSQLKNITYSGKSMNTCRKTTTKVQVTLFKKKSQKHVMK